MLYNKTHASIGRITDSHGLKPIMLKSFEAVYDHGQLHWLDESPNTMQRMRVIVTFVQELSEPFDSINIPPPELAGRMRILCNDNELMEPVVPEEDWDVLK